MDIKCYILSFRNKMLRCEFILPEGNMVKSVTILLVRFLNPSVLEMDI